MENPPAATSKPVANSVGWTAKYILLPAGANKPPINIADSFCIDPSDPFPERYSSNGVVLPPDIYPPTWESRKLVEDAVILASREHSNTELIRSESRQNRKHPISVLACKKSRRYYDEKNSSNQEIYHQGLSTSTGSISDVDSIELSHASYKDGV
jgi:hypothetical protein